MLHDQVVDAQNVLVELTVIPLSANGRTNDQISEVMSLVDKTGLFHERTQNGACIEGQWSDISALIYSCYERVQEQNPQGFLTVSIR